MVSRDVEAAIARYGQANYDAGRKHSYKPESFDQELIRVAANQLIALLARDDARIARLENVATTLRKVWPEMLFFADDDGNCPAQDEMKAALAALDDADAPGGAKNVAANVAER